MRHDPDGFTARGLRSWANSLIAALDPGCFAFVMATGIISNALWFEGFRWLSDALLAINVLGYSWLAALTLLRLARFRQAVWADLTNPRLVFSFFTIVAASCVLGAGASLRDFTTTASVLWIFAFAIWFVLIYFGFGVFAFLNTAGRADVVHGAWLIAIVGTEALVILGTQIAVSAGGLSGAVLVVGHMLWGTGLCLYAIFIALFAHRVFFFEVRTEDMTPNFHCPGADRQTADKG